MDAEKKAERIIEKKAGGDSDDGNKPSASSIVEQADAAAERLGKENERLEANIRRQEELMAKQALGGRSLAPSQPEKPKELTDREFKDKFLKGEIENPFR